MTAKRVIWGFRLVFYPGAALIAAVMLLHHGRPSEPPAPDTFHGATDQGRSFNMSLRDGKPFHLYTSVAARCADGRWYPYAWSEADARFDVEGGHVQLATHRALDRGWSADLRLDARLDEHRLRGTVELRFTRGAASCGSGEVPFVAAE